MPPRCANTMSAAKLFVQLSARRSNHIGILEILLPPQTRSFHFAASARQTRFRPALELRYATVARHMARRSFGLTSARRKTQVIYNPQQDENGKEMALQITPRAANRLSQIMAKDKNPHLALRIQVESGGCHGFQYLMSLTTLPSSLAASQSTTPAPGKTSSSPDVPSSAAQTEVVPSTTTSDAPSETGVGEDDTVFTFISDATEAGEDGARTLATGPKIILDGPSLELLNGSKVDYTMELIGSQFKIIDNPLATSSCGCGTSFDIKI
ncbi:uncharacterized protein BCR38DRAFT_455402 [Pseudomassariella vexata]|uniref:FeS cluster biogenesis domain-containing protein n=1 Tax=Pseudomassariella vexata TaxID=1141098 RepID=A0A1Y2EA40_9PEZI|nr:uncharacterized protein BCR38DRAFT_455402 [Pseudomassariella vexata]ORY68412.1 hypothetical protein BCR38DRAFT_455402 [Pseudomassariella vexata]